MSEVTIIITPRDRYTGIVQCIEQLDRCTEQDVSLWVLDLGYPESVLAPVRELLAGRVDARIIALGLITPMEALAKVRGELTTPYTVLLDNDTRVTPGWLPPLVAACGEGVGIVSPLVLERDGMDQGAELRNHLYTAELRMVDVEGSTMLIEQKHLRRTPVEDIPGERVATGTFELHCVLFDTAVLQAIEIPAMVIREHLDIAQQVLGRGEQILVEPASKVTFDNLATRMAWPDMRFFFHRWHRKRTADSSRLFEQRWGFRFYSEQSMYNWVVRRKTYLVSRWLGLPSGAANLATRVVKKLFCRDWDPLPDPDGASRPLPDAGVLPQRSHAER